MCGDMNYRRDTDVKIHELKPSDGSRKPSKRVGRGGGSGHGKTSCSGHKGQNARSGGHVKPGFEGGQMPLQRRLPKRGFKPPFSKVFAIMNLADIEALGMTDVTPEGLMENGALSSIKGGLKILGDGTLTKAITIKAHAFSKSAEEKIKASGGQAVVI